MNYGSQYLPRSDIGNKINSIILFLRDNPLDPGLESFLYTFVTINTFDVL
jgi:hypothetical protein